LLIATWQLSSTTVNCAAHERARMMPLLVGALVTTLDSVAISMGALHLQPQLGWALDGSGRCAEELTSDLDRFVEVPAVEQAAAADPDPWPPG
jgi:hypothetical protein